MLKIIHTGDIHLDSPFSGLDEKHAETRRTELRGTFSSLMTYARMNGVDIMLIAGDMFDRGFVTRETIALVMREFSRVPSCRIIISPGNHDPYTSDSVWDRVRFPDNVYIFDSSTLQKFEFPEINCDVYGYAFTGETMTTTPITHADIDGRLHLLCAHCDLDAPASVYAPVTTSQLVTSGFHYAALAHVHNPPELSRIGSCVYGYCGCLEGRGFDEVGAKSALYIEMEDDGKCSVRKLSFSRRRYEAVDVNVTGAQTTSDVRERIIASIREHKFGEDVMLRAVLTGELPQSMVLSPRAVADGIDAVFALEVRDETTPSLNTDYLREDPTVKGAFYRVLEPALYDPDPKKRKTALRALRYGLAAMAGESITD